MKCKECQREINAEDIQFCPYCGTKLERIDANEKSNNSKMQAQVETIKIGTDEISINNYMCMECREIIAIMRIANAFADKVVRLYKRAESLDTGTRFLKRIIKEYYPEMAQSIIDTEGQISFLVDISGEQLHDLSRQYIHSLNNIVLLSEAKSMSLEQENAYNKFKRGMDKESRFRVIGGGFGIKGAIEGMAIAGAVNQTTGAFYSLFNSIKDIGDNLSSNLDKRLLYSSLQKKVHIAVYNDVIQTYYFLNYLIKRPMNYEFCKDIQLVCNEAKKEIKTRGARVSVLKLITDYPYLKESFEIAAPFIGEEMDLLEYAKRLGNKEAVSYLEDFIKFKKDVRQYLKEDTNKYIELFFYRPFFKNVIYDRRNVVEGVYELGGKYLRVNLDYTQLPHEIDDDEFTVCLFCIKSPSSENYTLLCTNKKIYFSTREKSIEYSKLIKWDYTMKNTGVANIFFNEKMLAPINFGGETEAENLVDCLNYITLKIKYNIPKVFPDNIVSIDHEYQNKLYKIFGENSDYIREKYNRYHALDIFVKYGEDDVMDALEKDMEDIESNEKRTHKNFRVGDFFKLADEVYMIPLILDKLRIWVSEFGYFLQNQEAICYSKDDMSASDYLNILLTKEYIYYRGYNKKDKRKRELYHICYQDIRKFEYKYIDYYSRFYINDLEIKTNNTESSGRLIYQWLLFVILSMKYKKNVILKRALKVDEHKSYFSDLEKKKGCFITTATCLALDKGDSCYELNVFRKFRDEWLIKQEGGSFLIDEYYSIAPTIVNNIDKHINRISIYKEIWKNHLRLCLSAIEKRDYEECKSRYVNMVRALQRLFGN